MPPPPPSRLSRCGCCSTPLRRAAVATHVLFAAAGAHAIAYGLAGSATLKLPLHVSRLQSALAANGAALLLATAAAAFALPRLAPRAARAVDALLPCSVRRRARAGVGGVGGGGAAGGGGGGGGAGASAAGPLRRRRRAPDAAAGEGAGEDAGAADAGGANSDEEDEAASSPRCCACAARPLLRAVANLQEDADAADSIFVGFVALLWSFATAAPVCTLVFEKRWSSRGQLEAYVGVALACAAALAGVALATCARSGIMEHRGRARLSTLRLLAWPLLAHGLGCAVFLALHLDRLGLSVSASASPGAGAGAGAGESYSLWSPFM
jgi:hypothetical protein